MVRKLTDNHMRNAMEIINATLKTPKTPETLTPAETTLFFELAAIVPEGFKLETIKDRLPKDLGHGKDARDYVKAIVKDPNYFDDSKLEASITKEYMKKVHTFGSLRSPSEKDKAAIKEIMQKTIESVGSRNAGISSKQVNDFYCMNPEVRQKLAHEVVAGYMKKEKIGDVIDKDALNRAKQVVEFDGVWAAIKSNFAIHPDDNKRIFEQYNKIHGELSTKLANQANKGHDMGGGELMLSAPASAELDKGLRTNTANFIKAFGEAQGGKGHRVDRSVLFSKEFTEAIKLNHNDPEIGKQILEGLKRDKQYNPKELCKAFDACMKGIQAIRNDKSAGKVQIEDNIHTFIETVIPSIKQSTHITKQMLGKITGWTAEKEVKNEKVEVVEGKFAEQAKQDKAAKVGGQRIV